MNVVFQCLLFVLKRLYICYYIICMTVPLKQTEKFKLLHKTVLGVFKIALRVKDRQIFT